MEIRRFWFWPDFRARGKEWKTRLWFLSFPLFPRGVISTALLLSSFSERSDAEVAFVGAEFLSMWLPFSFLAKIRTFPAKSCARMAQERRSQRPSTGGTSPLAQTSLPPRFLRIDSPRISMRWALCTSRSRILSARVGSPICSCHLATGSWLVKIMDRIW